jgi:hypothetical protein
LAAIDLLHIPDSASVASAAAVINPAVPNKAEAMLFQQNARNQTIRGSKHVQPTSKGGL